MKSTPLGSPVRWAAVLCVGALATALVPGSLALADDAPTTSLLVATADSTVQTWQGEKTENHHSKPYVAALQPQGKGAFGEQFVSSDTDDQTDAKMGLVTFDLSAFEDAPATASLALTYLGYAGSGAATDTDTVQVTAVDDSTCTGDATSCATNDATWVTRPSFDSTAQTVATSEPFPLGSTAYTDKMTVSQPTTITVDVKDIVAQQFAQDRHVITLAIGETGHHDIRFASLESAGVLGNATRAIAPTLIVPALPSAPDDSEPATPAEPGPGEKPGDTVLWYRQPASATQTRLPAGMNLSADNNQWQQTTLPIGNGKIGATVWGEVGKDRLTFNEETLWSGGPGSQASYSGGNVAEYGQNGKALLNLDKQLEAGAQTVPTDQLRYLTGGLNANEQGAYQNWGNIYLDFGLGSTPAATGYQRQLDLSTGVASVQFTQGDVHYSRDYFVSHPDNVLVSRLSTDKEGGLNVTISAPTNPGFTKSEESSTVAGDVLTVKGTLANNGLHFNQQIKAVPDTGTVQAGADGASLKVTGATTVTLYVGAATDYKQTYPTYRTGETVASLNARVADTVSKAAFKSYQDVLDAHVADQRALFDRVALDLGQTPSKDDGALPTDQLLEAYVTGQATAPQQRQLETTVYQYGRYLAIGSTREDSQLPSNLQGIWSSTADDNAHGNTPWGSDFHMNVNLQMNYWPIYSSNLAQLSAPMIAYAQGLVEPGRVTAQVYAGATTAEGTPIGQGAGYMAHTENTAYGWTTPGNLFSWGWSPAAMPWLLQNVYEAYEYSGDKAQLEDTIYPLMREEANFYVNYLLHRSAQKASDGSERLTTGVAYSPEHGPQGTDGNTYESSLVWQLLNDSIEAATVLGTDTALVGNVEACAVQNWAKDNDGAFVNKDANRSWACAQSLLKPIEVGDSGQIKEWYFEGALGKDQNGQTITDYQQNHRHMSHLLGLFPGDLITVDNPTFMDAAKYSMTQRGDDATGWGVAQRINSWARTGDGNHAHQLIALQMKNAMYPNLFDAHPPFQIDGNFGNTSGVDEMLMQSNSTFTAVNGQTYHNYTNILPALPDAWPSGSVSGLVARGNFTVGITWSDMSTDKVTLTSQQGTDAAVKISRGTPADYRVTDAGQVVDHQVVANAKGDQLLVFPTVKGHTYVIELKSAPLDGATSAAPDPNASATATSTPDPTGSGTATSAPNPTGSSSSDPSASETASSAPGPSASGTAGVGSASSSAKPSTSGTDSSGTGGQPQASHAEGMQSGTGTDGDAHGTGANTGAHGTDGNGSGGDNSSSKAGDQATGGKDAGALGAGIEATGGKGAGDKADDEAGDGKGADGKGGGTSTAKSGLLHLSSTGASGFLLAAAAAAASAGAGALLIRRRRQSR